MTSTLKILVVDDDRLNRVVIIRILRESGHDVVEASNGKEAIAIFEQQQPDLIVMDVMMPVMDGYQATRIIKQSNSEQFIPVIFLTALSDEASLVKGIESGGDDFLSKPFNKAILSAKISALMRVKELYEIQKQQRKALEVYQQQQQQEFNIARKVFDKFFQRSCLYVNNIKSLISSVALFNGDILLASPTPTGGLRILLGDFTGHGLGAAIGTMPVADIFYSMTEKGYLIEDVCLEINNKLYQILPTELFCAAVILEVNATFELLSIVNAGLPDVLLYHNGKIQHYVQSQSMPLGILVKGSSLAIKSARFKVNATWRVYLYTDGIIEANNAFNELFGMDRFVNCIEASTDPEQIFDYIKQCLDNFLENNAQSDDISLVEVLCDAQQFNQSLAARNIILSKPPEPLEWEFSLTLQASSLKVINPLPLLNKVIIELQSLGHRTDEVFTILSELYTNALHHGVLKLDSSLRHSVHSYLKYYQERERKLAHLTQGSVFLKIKHIPKTMGGKLIIYVRDSGKGFNRQGVKSFLRDNQNLHGRGLALIENLCTHVSYLEQGSAVQVVYEWS